MYSPHHILWYSEYETTDKYMIRLSTYSEEEIQIHLSKDLGLMKIKLEYLYQIVQSTLVVQLQIRKTNLSQMALSHKSDNPLKWSNPVSQFHGLYLTIIKLQLRVYYYLQFTLRVSISYQISTTCQTLSGRREYSELVVVKVLRVLLQKGIVREMFLSLTIAKP